MKRRLLTALLALGTIAGYTTGLHQLAHRHRQCGDPPAATTVQPPMSDVPPPATSGPE